MTLDRRRQWLALAAVGAAAAGAGVAGYLWQRRQSAAPAAAGDPVAGAFWALELDTPDQPPRRLAMRSFAGRPLVLNFWGTWCPPCVREMPALDRFHRQHAARGWQVVGIAADNPAQVRDFLARTPVGFPIAMAGFEGIELSRRLGNVSGGLPFTIVFGAAGSVLHRQMGEVSEQQLEAWAKGFS